MWDNADKTIKRIESWIDIFFIIQIYIIPNIVPKKMKIVHSNILILLENLCRWKNHLSLHMGLNTTVHPLMNNSLNLRVVFIRDVRIRLRHFHHLAMDSYLHQKILLWQIVILCIHWNRRISVIMILDVSCTVIWCLMTPSFI